MKRLCIDMSGMGGNYEYHCQQMFWHAVTKCNTKSFEAISRSMVKYYKKKKLHPSGASFGVALQHAYHYLNDGRVKYYTGFAKKRFYEANIKL